jgi:adenine phosphoribosyltransferase
MSDLKQYIRDIPDFPKAGILFRDISPLLRHHFDKVIVTLAGLLSEPEWASVDAIAGIEARGFVLASALAQHQQKGFVPIRKEGKLPPPVVRKAYDLEYGNATLEVAAGEGRLIIVDDVLATGGTMSAAAELATQAGYEVTALVSLIELGLVRDFKWKHLSVRTAIVYP